MQHDKQILVEYYNKKAQEYEEVYTRQNKTRLDEQRIISEYIVSHFQDKIVLELACGTGYWTKYLLLVAKEIVAIDQSREMLTISQNRYGESSNIAFFIADAYNPPMHNPAFTGCMTNFLFSHISRNEITSFLETLHTRLAKHAFVMFVDSNYQKGQGGRLVKKKGHKDTWKRRKLNNGEEYDILKNYFSEEELKNIFGKYTKNLAIKYMKNFWIVGYYLEK